jgi:long-chain acyl-CoA synthetase
LPGLVHILTIDRVSGLPSALEVAADPDIAAFRARCAEVEPSDIATYIYTSGTTGDPKAAILTHHNFWSVAHATLGLARIEPGDRSIVFLPLAHSLQRFAMYRGLLEVVSGVYAESIEKVTDALLFGRPTLLATVPRMLEKIRDRMLATVRARGGTAERVFEWAMGVGRKRALALESKQPLSRFTRLQLRLADRLVFEKIRARMGGELRVLISGGAALDPEVARFYLAMGIRVLEGWGLTETSAPATANTEEDFRLGSVGKPLPGVDVRRDADGELLVRGPGVFVGYLKDPAATAAALQDGWFRTGDIGTIDADGFVRITDRKKEILVTAGGKNIPPVNIEKRLERSPFVSQAVAIGDRRPYLVALLVPDAEAVSAYARDHGLPDEPLAASVRRPQIDSLIQTAVAEANRELASFESIKRFAVLGAPFSVETGEITPTLKLKRRIIEEKYRVDIERLYGTSV